MLETRLLLLVTVALVVAGCKRSEPSATPIARLDNRTLTLEEITAQLDSTREVTSAQLNEYIQRWVNSEILYREAVRRGLDQKESFQARVEGVRRQLAINALLDEVVYTPQVCESTPEEIVQYYQARTNEFALSTDVALVSFALFQDRDLANAFRTRILQGARWRDALQQVLSDPQRSALVVARVDSAYHTQSTLFPVELWRVASASGRAEPSFPIRTAEGFYVLITWKFTRSGQPADLAYVAQEIRGRLAIERRQRVLADLMETLRAKHSVEILVGTGDTTAWKYR
ncbi:MAG: hypothetical protein FJ217_09065 [Ignavibacteria bacterium]|nr:hypothetical protein [Ignavibacteria bacterium]